MQIREMFEKDIERPLKGVIKVAQTDEDNIYQELEEYVVTKELQKHFSKFYEKYQDGIDGYTDKMGAWISGFFGSGKSHYLKILSYLLENKEVKGNRALDYFEDKIQDPMVLANMKRTADVETEVILFNIDSKSSLDGKSKEDAILKVLMKVFYEHRGYYGDIPGVAEMEKYLDQKGVYYDFKSEFKELAGEEWVDRRNTFYFDADFVIGALTKVTDMSEESARNWFENGVNNYEISIEKFAKDVKEYIEQKGDNFHLVFLVDEIGQYIGDSRKLMLNLQTVTEDIGTYCNGKVWIIVTAQESIDSLLKVKGDDFSRIQGRFDTRLSLSSISVDEVIKKRILAKKEFVNQKLKQIYLEDNNNAKLKNLVSFKESTADLRGYDDANEFADVYPFVPYHFKLLQKVFEQVRKHGSSGKHLSEGERSMLSAFQESALQFKTLEEGTLIPLYAFYETIREFLTPSVARVIEGAYENPALKDDDFNMDVLKVLFMIKYIDDLPANLDNLATLMVTKINEDKLELKERIKVSLRKLISQNLIQKNGDVYIFLTDDEQDINRDIKATKVEEEIVKREISNYIYQDLFDDRKFRYKNKHSFNFNRKMDEKNYGNQTASIGINFISPLSDYFPLSDQELLMQTSGNDELWIRLQGNEGYVEEMEEALKIEEYRKQKNIQQMPENMQNILNNKRVEATQRKRRVKELISDAIKSAQFFINGEQVIVKGSSVREKIAGGMNHLVENVYTKLEYIKVHVENDNELLAIARSGEEQLALDVEVESNELALREMKDFINLQHDYSKQVRTKILLEHFNAKPYGWREYDIAGLIATLLKDQFLRITYNGDYVEPESKNILNALIKSSDVDRAIITKRVRVDDGLLRKARNIAKNVFNKTDLPDDEDGLVHEIKRLIEDQKKEVRSYKERYEGRKYPGESLLDKGLEYFNQFNSRMDNASFFTKIKEREDELLDWEEDVSLVISFFENQKPIFDQGLEALSKYEENQSYLEDDSTQETVQQLGNIVNDPIPYKKIKDIPELAHKIDQAIQNVLAKKKALAKDEVQLTYDNLMLKTNTDGVTEETILKIKRTFDDLLGSIDRFVNIYKVDAVITQNKNYKERFERTIEKEIKESHERYKVNGDERDQTPPLPPTPSTKRVRIQELVSVRKLTSESDVDRYVNSLSNELKQLIRENNIEFID
ncbi:BREX system P-loop protein BrxC [Salinicoccus roseus]|uniref:BREX system P-loop protein BrxC n=1 Tax=Salinicoccus roseus TaxID=45670 RepID=UPI00352426B7